MQMVLIGFWPSILSFVFYVGLYRYSPIAFKFVLILTNITFLQNVV